MKIIVYPDKEALALALGDLIIDSVKAKPNLILGLPGEIFTEPFFFLTLDRLFTAVVRNEVAFGQTRFFATHEFMGLDLQNPLSNASNLWKRVLKPIEVLPRNIFLLDGNAPDPEFECLKYESKIKWLGGIELQLLTLGVRGEIARNEMASSLGSRCRLQILYPEHFTGDHRFTATNQPRSVLTMGVASLMEAKRVVITASGTDHANAVARCFDGPVSSAAPASAFQGHPSCTVFLDRTAASYCRASRGIPL